MNARRLATAVTLAVLTIGGSAVAVANASTSGTDDPSSSTSSSSTPSTETSSTSPTLEPLAPGATTLSSDEAATIALGRVGGGQVRSVERELEHGRTEWRVEIVNGGRQIEVRVDATTGGITRVEDNNSAQDDSNRGSGNATGNATGDDRGGHGGGENGDDNGGRR